jgi:hypothetical protein
LNESIQKYFEDFDAEYRLICERLQELITAAIPEAEAKIWHGHPVWFDAGNPIVGISKLKGCIRLLFWSGQSFGEAELQNEGKFRAAEKRYSSPDQVDPEAVLRWCVKAFEIQWDYKNIVKRKGVLEPLKGIKNETT